jgi:hypothetical protein
MSGRDRRVGVAFVLALVAFVVWFAFGQDSSGGPGSPSLGELAAIAQQAAASDAANPLVLHDGLTPEAMKVADAFVTAQYVKHDCRALASLSRQPKGLAEGFLPTSFGDCARSLRMDRQSGAHLVRGSRLLQHQGCYIPTGIGPGVAVKSDECIRYAEEGRYTTTGGKRTLDCNGGYFRIFMDKIGSHWFVVAESPGLNWNDGRCTSRDNSFWKRAEPWSTSGS